MEELGVYAFFKDVYGFTKQDVDSLGVDVVEKVLIFHRVKDEMMNLHKKRE